MDTNRHEYRGYLPANNAPSPKLLRKLSRAGGAGQVTRVERNDEATNCKRCQAVVCAVFSASGMGVSHENPPRTPRDREQAADSTAFRPRRIQGGTRCPQRVAKNPRKLSGLIYLRLRQFVCHRLRRSRSTFAGDRPKSDARTHRTPKHFVRKMTGRGLFCFRPAVAGLWECVRVLASLFRTLDASSLLAQKSSGTLIRSVLSEYTDFTNPDRALLSNQEAEHHGY